MNENATNKKLPQIIHARNLINVSLLPCSDKKVKLAVC